MIVACELVRWPHKTSVSKFSAQKSGCLAFSGRGFILGAFVFSFVVVVVVVVVAQVSAHSSRHFRHTSKHL